MTLQAVQAAHSKLRRASRNQEEARLELRRSIEAARETHTLEQIGEVLGVSRQRVHAIVRDTGGLGDDGGDR